MLADHRMHTTLPTTDLERARRFWRDTLGFKLAFEVEGGAIMFEAAGGTRFVTFLTSVETRGGHTQCGFEVEDIASVVADLKGKGVVLEEYDYPTLKTTGGIAETAAGHSAWFKDPDGNLVGLVQFE
jgi:catechol 2,3-dioxygenase-like lactoylglutathione lyase family enzyme